MALFDAYDPLTYSGSGQGGMLDRLLAQIGAQSGYQPSQGFGPDGQAQPITVGDYQMPRVGPAQQFTPDPAAIPQNAQPTQGYAQEQATAQAAAQARDLAAAQARGMTPQQYAALPISDRQQQAPQQQSLLAPQYSAGGLSGAFHGAMNNRERGLVGMLGGAIEGGMGQGLGSPQEQANRSVQQTYQALVAAGVPQNKAVLAAINPEYGKTVVAEALSNKQKYSKIGQDGLGREQYGFVDETNQTVNGKPISQQPAQDAGGGGLGNMDLTGKDYLASLPKSEANIIVQMAEGTMAPPSSFALGKPIWASRMAAAKNYDPTFDATNWSGRVAGVKDFSAGKSAEMVRSANQTLHHVGSLIDSMDALNNGDYPLKNRIGNYASEAMGSGAQGSFRSNAHAVATELSKVFKGSNLSDAEVHAWEQNLHENMSPEQQHTQVLKLKELLQGSLSALEEKRLNSMGPIAAEKAGPLIKPEGQRVLDRIDQWAKGNAPQSSAPKTKTGVSWSVVQ